MKKDSYIDALLLVTIIGISLMLVDLFEGDKNDVQSVQVFSSVVRAESATNPSDPTPTPTPDCGDGWYYDRGLGACVFDYNGPVPPILPTPTPNCGDDWVYDEWLQACVYNGPGPHPTPTPNCGDDWVYDEDLCACVHDGGGPYPTPTPSCGEGTIYDTNTNTCIDISNLLPPMPEDPDQPIMRQAGPNEPPYGWIDHIDQTFHEKFYVPGTPYSLKYDSEYHKGLLNDRDIEIPLVGQDLEPNLIKIIVHIEIAGQIHNIEIEPSQNLIYTFDWDGLDGSGNPVRSIVNAKIDIHYLYEGTYSNVVEGDADRVYNVRYFSQLPTLTGIVNEGIRDLINSSHTTVSTSYEKLLKPTDMSWFTHQQGLAGWTISGHTGYTDYHFTGLLSKEDSSWTIDLDSYFDLDDYSDPSDFRGYVASEMSSNGTMYYGTSSGIYAKGTNGIIETLVNLDGHVLGSYTIGSGGDLLGIQDFCYDSVNNDILFVLAHYKVVNDGWDVHYSAWRRSSSGSYSPLTADSEFSSTVYEYVTYGEQAPSPYASDIEFSEINDIEVDGDGAIYLNVEGLTEDTSDIIRIAANGYYSAVVGYDNDTESWVISCLEVSEDGSLYFAVENNIEYPWWRSGIVTISSEGVFERLVGSLDLSYSSEGLEYNPLSPLNVSIDGANDIEVASNGYVYIASGRYIWKLIPGKSITVVAGTGVSPEEELNGNFGNAKSINILPADLVLSPDDHLFVFEKPLNECPDCSMRVFKLPGNRELSRGNDSYYLVPASDGKLVYKYDINGLHKETVDAVTGRIMQAFEYDANNQLKGVIDSNGLRTDIIRNSTTGNPEKIVSPYGIETILTVNNDGYLETITKPGNRTITLGYKNGKLLNSIDLYGYDFSVDYDQLSRATYVEGPYEDQGLSDTVQRIDHSYSKYEVVSTSTMGRATSQEIEAITDDTYTRKITSTDGLVTLVDVDETTEDREITTPDGLKITVNNGLHPVFNLQAPVPNTIDINDTSSARSKLIRYYYDAEISDPDNPLTVQLQTKTVVCEGRTTTYEYDARGTTPMMTVTTPEGRKSRMLYDSSGRVSQLFIPDSSLAATIYDYDDDGRVETITKGSGATARTVSCDYYSSDGRLMAVTDTLNRVITIAYDDYGFPETVTFPDGNAVSYTRDVKGDIKTVTLPNGSVHAFNYGLMRETKDIIEPDVDGTARTTVHNYNYDMQLENVTYPSGKVLDMVYDLTSGRLTNTMLQQGTESESTSYAYDNVGRMDTITGENGIVDYDYNGTLLETVSATGTVVGSVTLEYPIPGSGDDFRVSGYRVNNESSVGYSYDDDGLLTTVGAMELIRDAVTGLLHATTVGSVLDLVTRNEFGEVTDYLVVAVNVGVFSAEWNLDLIGRIETRSETIGVSTIEWGYDYDDVGRLERVINEATGETLAEWTYDANGNRLSETLYSGGVGSTTRFVYDARDRLIGWGDGYTTTAFTYSLDGELETKTLGLNVTQYGYDLAGNLTSVENPNGDVVEYKSDALGRRIERQWTPLGQSADTTRWLYGSGVAPLAELDDQNQIVTQFVYATRSYVPDYLTKGGVTYRVITDRQGSVRLVVNVTTGTVAQRMTWDAWGNLLEDTNPGFQPFGFAGSMWDSQAGLHHLGAREYDPAIGRWLTSDPIGFNGGLNHYAYCDNDPVNFFDPSGLGSEGNPWQDGLKPPDPSMPYGPLTPQQAQTINNRNRVLGTTAGIIAGGALIETGWFGLFVGTVVYELYNETHPTAHPTVFPQNEYDVEIQDDNIVIHENKHPSNK